MGDVVDLKRTPPVDDQELIADLCRFAEGLLTEKQVRKRHRLAESEWQRLGSDEGNELVEKIEAEKIRRIRDGSSKREKSQQLITKAPGILDGIMSDPAASPRHRVDAIKTLDGMAANGPAGVPAADRFVIRIDIGGDVLHFDKPIAIDVADGTRAIDVDDSNPNDIDTPWGMFPATAAKKPQDGGSGENTI